MAPPARVTKRSSPPWCIVSWLSKALAALYRSPWMRVHDHTGTRVEPRRPRNCCYSKRKHGLYTPGKVKGRKHMRRGLSFFFFFCDVHTNVLYCAAATAAALFEDACSSLSLSEVVAVSPEHHLAGAPARPLRAPCTGPGGEREKVNASAPAWCRVCVPGMREGPMPIKPHARTCNGSPTKHIEVQF